MPLAGVITACPFWAGEANLSGVIVCHCATVTDGDVAEALEDGARRLCEVCRRTGAAQQCGGCIVAVRQAVCDHVARSLVPRREPVRAAS